MTTSTDSLLSDSDCDGIAEQRCGRRQRFAETSMSRVTHLPSCGTCSRAAHRHPKPLPAANATYPD